MPFLDRRQLMAVVIAAITLVPSIFVGHDIAAVSALDNTTLPGWNLVFSDDFTTPIARGSFASSTAGRYFLYTGKDTSGNGTYSPDIIAVQNGVLDVAIGTVNGVHKVAGFGPLIGGPSSTDLLGMRVAFRIRADRMVGYKGVPLLWPKSGNWPWDGEMNFPESNFDGRPYAFMHRQNATVGSDQDWYATPLGTSWQDWHDYVIEWVPGVRAEFYLDGVSIGRSTDRVPTSAMHLVMQFETQLGGGAPSNSVSGHVQIDHLAVWAMTTGSAVAPAPTPAPTPNPTPTPGTTPSPSPSPTPGATPTPGANPTPGTTPTPGASASPGPSSTPTIPTPGTTPIPAAGPTPAATSTLLRYGDASRHITYSDGWSVATHRLYTGGSVHYARTRNATASLRFVGSGVTWLGPKGPTRGKANVYIDGRFVRAIDLYAPRFLGRPLALFTRTWTKPGTHTLTIKVAGMPGRPIVAIDAFTVRR